MKITKVSVYLPDNNDWRPICCRVFTDEGIYGDGEAAVAYGIGAPAAYGMVQDLARHIIGMNPLDNEVIWDKLYRTSFWGQNGGPIVFSGISAIDMALWDIKGKYFNVPVYQLLGGKKRDKLRAYASQLQFGWEDGTDTEPRVSLEDYAEAARRAVAEGYDCVKYDFFTFDVDGRPFTPEDFQTLRPTYFINLIESRMAAVREAVGPDVDIIVENHSNPDMNSAIQIGLAVKKYNVFYFEEPNTPTPKTAKYIRDMLQLPIAHGERLYSRWGFAPYFENGSVQVIQPDLGNTGGITEGKKICDMGYTYDVSVQLHTCGSPLSTAASLQVEAAIPNFCIHEHHEIGIQQYNKKYCIYDYQPINGKYEVPNLPGLGNEWSDYVLNCKEQVSIT